MAAQLHQVIAVLLSAVLCINGNVIFSEQVACPAMCPSIYAPVCATNGRVYKEFASPCDLQASNCRETRNGLQAYQQADMAWCNTVQVDNLWERLGNISLESTGCMKPCTMIYQPICVTNGKYRALISNQCLLETFNCALAKLGISEHLRVLRQETC